MTEVSVCLSVHTRGKGVTPSPFHTYFQPLVPCPFQGYPSDWSQVPSSVLGSFTGLWSQVLSQGIPVPGVGFPQYQVRRGYPSPRQEVPSLRWGYSSPRQGYPSPRQGYLCLGYPLVRTGLGYPPGQDRTWVPPSPSPKTEQQSEYLLCSWQYATCVHAGGFSC